jgi:hypothetical protein
MVWGLLAVLVLWAGIAAWRRGQEPVRPPPPPGPRAGDDEIDHATLEQAEREVRDLDTDAKGRPLEDTLGDDWGPGTPKPPYT